MSGLRRFKPYSAYKDSGVEWLGEIPAHWPVAPISLRYDVQLGKMLDSSKITGQHLRHYLRVFDVQWGAINTSDLPEMDFDRDARERFRLAVGDLLVNEGGSYPGRSAIWQGDIDECYYQKALHRLRVLQPREDLPQFLYYLMYWAANQGVFVAGGNETTIEHLPAEKLRRYRFAFPPRDEQRAITAFLDRETARIDGLVARKERLVDLLQEQRTALITRAVTKGLDPNVPMKDSGVEWLGEIPAHWEVERIKWAARMVSGHTPDKKVESYWEGGDIPWVSLADTGQLREVDHIAKTAVSTTADGIEHSSANVLPAGTVVFSRDATIGLCAITRAGMAVSQHFIGWVCGPRLQPEYLLLVLRSMTQELERLTMGATVRTIGMPDVKRLATPIPPCTEQAEIVRHVLHHRARIDALVAKVRDALEGLKELRTALISAAVTGKIDVREEVA